jgi:hypothetical protein
MSVLGGTATRIKRIGITGDGVASVARALARAQGHDVVEVHEACDLAVVEASRPEEVEVYEDGRTVVVVVPRRVRSSELERFRAVGAARVFDATASVLDLAFAFSDLLFDSLCAQRRYARAHGGARVRFRRVGDREFAKGRLVGIASAGTYLVTEELEPAGTPIEMELSLARQPVRLLGRVACTAGRDDRRGFGIEFALDSNDVAPRVSDVASHLKMPPPTQSPSNSGLPAHQP